MADRFLNHFLENCITTSFCVLFEERDVAKLVYVWFFWGSMVPKRYDKNKNACFCLCDTLLTIKNASSHHEVCKNHQEPDLATLELVLFWFSNTLKLNQRWVTRAAQSSWPISCWLACEQQAHHHAKSKVASFGQSAGFFATDIFVCLMCECLHSCSNRFTGLTSWIRLWLAQMQQNGQIFLLVVFNLNILFLVIGNWTNRS